MIEYLTVEQAAERMQVSCKTMYGLFRAWRASAGRDGVRQRAGSISARRTTCGSITGERARR